MRIPSWHAGNLPADRTTKTLTTIMIDLIQKRIMYQLHRKYFEKRRDLLTQQ
jgi:hypothetical protein